MSIIELARIRHKGTAGTCEGCGGTSDMWYGFVDIGAWPAQWYCGRCTIFCNGCGRFRPKTPLTYTLCGGIGRVCLECAEMGRVEVVG